MYENVISVYYLCSSHCVLSCSFLSSSVLGLVPCPSMLQVGLDPGTIRKSSFSDIFVERLLAFNNLQI